MSTHNLSLRYDLTEQSADDASRPRFVFEPDRNSGHEMRLTATNLASVDRLDVRWSSADSMKEDPVKAYLAKIGAKGGSVLSAAKLASNRENAKKAGRPKGAKDGAPRTRRAAK